ncbi:MAG: hypothetical protein ACJA0V_002925 [Planctomycetota bacterium]|jgi:hypothetical protein
MGSARSLTLPLSLAQIVTLLRAWGAACQWAIHGFRLGFLERRNPRAACYVDDCL